MEDILGELNKSELKLEFEDSEKAKISLPETIIFIIIAGSADAFELFSAFAFAIPVIGQAIWIMALIYGFFVSAIILFWSIIRGASGGFIVGRIVKRKIAPLIAGFTVDFFTGGFLPIRTITLIIVIWLNNKFTEKHRDKILKLISSLK